MGERVPVHANHAFNAGVLRQVSGSAAGNPFLFAGGAGLFGSGVEAEDKYKEQGCTLDTTRHLLGGALATHVHILTQGGG